MIYAEFYHMSVAGSWNNNVSSPIPACGDRSVIILDGRSNMSTHLDITRKECKARGYCGFTINRGERFSDGKVIHKYESV